jgi:hypothetical protein
MIFKSLKRKLIVFGAILGGGITIASLLAAGSSQPVMAAHN